MLTTNQKFPEFQLSNQDNKMRSLKDYAGQWLVLYVYPKDDTPGCTLQGKSFTEQKNLFDQLHVKIVGVSQDDIKSHKEFCNKYSFTIELLADPQAQLLKAAGVGQSEWKGTMYWNRTTFVIDPNGMLKKVYENVNPEGHEAVLLKDIKEMQSAGKMSMSGKVKPIPDGYHSMTPYLSFKGAGEAMEFYKKAFGAQEIMRMPGDKGKIMHAEMQIGNSRFMMADESSEMGNRSSLSLDGSPVTFMIYVEDCDHVFKQAINAGAKELMAVKNQFYGDRSGTVQDPYGFTWHVSTHIEDLSNEEMKKRSTEAHN